MLVRPSTWGLLAVALVSACAALLAMPTSRPGAAAQPALDDGAVLASASFKPVATDPLPRTAAQARRRKAPTAYKVARIRAGRSVALRSKPGGASVARLGARTEFGSKRVMAVAERRGRWLGVTATERPNGKLGWIDSRSGAVDVARTKVSLRADLSRKRVDLRVGRRVVARMSVAVGRPGSPTPTGRFAITDKLSGGSYGPYYGCCILALSGHQNNTPAGWKGGDRLAIHGTNAPSTIGMRASAGCLRGSDRNLKLLMRRVPVGTPVFIRR